MRKYIGDTYILGSGETKPIDVLDGARAYEFDTLNHFLKVTGLWKQVSSSSSSSSSFSSPTGITGINISGSDYFTGSASFSGAGGISVYLKPNNNIIISGLSTGTIQPWNVGSGYFPTGNLDTLFIPFDRAFPKVPVVCAQVSRVYDSNPIVGQDISGVSTTGFWLNITDSPNTGVYSYSYIATTGSGYFEIGTGPITDLSSQINTTNNNLTTTGVTLHNEITGLSGIFNSFAKGATLAHPTGVLTGSFIVWKCQFPCTLTGLAGYRETGTYAAINARKNGSLKHLPIDLVIDPDQAWVSTGVQNTTFSPGDKLEIMVTAVSGAPKQVAIQLDFTKP